MNAKCLGRRKVFLLTVSSVLAVQGCGGGSSGTGADPTFTVGGTVAGLAAGTSVVVTDNSTDAVTVSANVAFSFPHSIADGGSYSVTVATQPAGQICSVASPSGVISGANITSVAVTCVPATYTIGATVSGLLPGGSIVLLDNGADSLTVTANATVTFATPVVAGNPYVVSVGTQPTGQSCVVSNGAGTTTIANVTNIEVLCPSETTLWTFAPAGMYGSGSVAGVIRGSDGSLYGTTSSDGANGMGTVFKVTSSGVGSTLWNFGTGSNDAQEPLAGLVEGSDGNFYGSTIAGGAHGQGTVYRITPAGAEAVLWSFGGPGDGASPTSTLTQAGDGTLYGTTASGGANGAGTVFSITATGVETVLWSFGPTAADGQTPWGGVIQAADGSCYGTTTKGGANNSGTVFRVTAAGVETVLWSFGSPTDGATPFGNLLQASDGDFYGTTRDGGTAGGGVGFKITAAGMEDVVWNFNHTTGEAPIAGLIQGIDGSFYGTTSAGGLGGGLGTVFRATPAGEVLVIWDKFAYQTELQAGVIQGKDGALYGATIGNPGITPATQGIVFTIAF